MSSLPPPAGLVLLALLALRGAPGVDAPTRDSALESGAVLELSIRAPEGTRTSHYRLVQRDARGRERTVGVVRWLVGASPASLATRVPETRVETETTWLDAETRVLVSERRHPRGDVLVWREVRPHSGRTVWLSPDPRGGYQSTEPVGRDLVRRRVEDPELLLHLVERVRRGEAVEPCARVFLAREQAVVELSIAVQRVGTARLLELRRPDGGLEARFTFEGDELVSFQEGELGPVARLVPRAEYEALLPAPGA